MQTFARRTFTPIDTLTFRTQVRSEQAEDIKEPPEEGVNIHGLFLEGAKWDYKKQQVENSDPKIPIILMPVIWLEPVVIGEFHDDKVYTCPLYKTSLRYGELLTTGHSTNYVMSLDIPSEVPQEYWIRRGVALICMTDD